MKMHLMVSTPEAPRPSLRSARTAIANATYAILFRYAYWLTLRRDYAAEVADWTCRSVEDDDLLSLNDLLRRCRHALVTLRSPKISPHTLTKPESADLHRQISRLHMDQRECLALQLCAKLDIPDIAKVTEKPETWVRDCLYTARISLSTCL